MGTPIPCPAAASRPQPEVADILRRYLPRFLRDRRLTLKQFRVVRAIISCRTKALGGHIQACDHCDFQKPVYNSCGDRHCPKCQGSAKRKWLVKRLKELLPVHHFHVVFTIPHLLNPLVGYNRKLMFDLLFHASAETLQSFGRGHLKARMGFFGILHTWGQTLMLHPHIHYIVPAGGLALLGKEWIDHPGKGKFLFHAPSMSNVFQGIFIRRLKRLFFADQLVIPDSLEITDNRAFEMFMDQVANRKWVVQAKQPFSGPEEIVLYIGRYTHRTAISNYRILSCDDGDVVFSHKKYRKNKSPIMDNKSLPADEFIMRYLQHVLPDHFHKIRFFGFMSNGKREENLALAKQRIRRKGCAIELSESVVDDLISSLTPSAPTCPECEQGQLRATESIAAEGYVYIEIADAS